MIRTEKCDSYIGKRVRLNRDLGNKAYIVPSGRVMKIAAHWRGRVMLESPNCLPQAEALILRQVPFWAFDLVGENDPYCRICGCVDEAGCRCGCRWIDVDKTLCSACLIPLLDWAQRTKQGLSAVATLMQVLGWGYTKASYFLNACPDTERRIRWDDRGFYRWVPATTEKVMR